MKILQFLDKIGLIDRKLTRVLFARRKKKLLPQIRGLSKKNTHKKCKLLSFNNGRNRATSQAERKKCQHIFFSSGLYLFFRLCFFSHRIPHYLHSSCEVFVSLPGVFERTEKLSTKKRHKHQSAHQQSIPQMAVLLFHLLLLLFASFMDRLFSLA